MTYLSHHVCVCRADFVDSKPSGCKGQSFTLSLEWVLLVNLSRS